LSTLDPQTRAFEDTVAATRDQAKTVFAHTMFLVAATAGVAALGSYLGRNLSGTVAIVCFVIGIGLSFGIGFARGSSPLAMGLLFGMGGFLGLGAGRGLASYANLENGTTIIAQAAGMTALLVGALGAYGYATRRNFAAWGKTLFWLTIGLFVAGIVLIFVRSAGGQMIWASLGVVIFSAWTIYDFNRLRRARPDDAVFIACGIFLDIFNLFQFLLQLIGLSRD
jgi:FtsH-binding integral membrane protein